MATSEYPWPSVASDYDNLFDAVKAKKDLEVVIHLDKASKTKKLSFTLEVRHRAKELMVDAMVFDDFAKLQQAASKLHKKLVETKKL
jgi:hypothetical protein